MTRVTDIVIRLIEMVLVLLMSFRVTLLCGLHSSVQS